MAAKSEDMDSLLIEALRHDRQEAFIRIFRRYFADLVVFASTIIRDRQMCEDIVQNVFLKLWESRYLDFNGTSVRRYLIQSVRNQCIDELRHRKVLNQYMAEFNEDLWEKGTEHYILYSDLLRRYRAALKQLTPEERNVVILSRHQGMKYADIARLYNISVRGVESRMSRALKRLQVLLECNNDNF